MAAPVRPKPTISIAQLAGSGTAGALASSERTSRHAAPNAIPDDSDRLPASLRALAWAEQLPYATVRPRVSARVTRGLVENNEGGVIVPARVHGNEVMARNSALYIQRIEKLFADLKRLAPRPNDPDWAASTVPERMGATDSPA